MTVTTGYWLAYAFGVLAGGLVVSLIFRLRDKPHGRFVVNTTDPEKDVFLVEFEIPLASVIGLRTLRLKVVNQSKSRE